MPPLIPSCPTTTTSDEIITLAHGEGGRLTRRLIEQRILPRLKNTYLHELADAAVLPQLQGAPVMTTDSYVVSPLRFPGGDIGKLAIFGTANDLIVSGARPRWISLAMIIEEGFTMASLEHVLDSVASAAKEADVQVVTGDTKVVPRGAADGIFLTTTGLGETIPPAPLGPTSFQVGDFILVSGPIGQHGIAILAQRENLEFAPPPSSDCGLLWNAAESLRSAGCQVRTMRDATRGGVAAVLHEWAAGSSTTLAIDEHAVPVSNEVRGVSELLGLDPLHLPNEGTMLIAVSENSKDCAIEALRRGGGCPEASVIGQVVERRSVPVFVRRGQTAEIPLEEPPGALLPRIC